MFERLSLKNVLPILKSVSGLVLASMASMASMLRRVWRSFALSRRVGRRSVRVRLHLLGKHRLAGLPIIVWDGLTRGNK